MLDDPRDMIIIFFEFELQVIQWPCSRYTWYFYECCILVGCFNFYVIRAAKRRSFNPDAMILHSIVPVLKSDSLLAIHHYSSSNSIA